MKECTAIPAVSRINEMFVHLNRSVNGRCVALYNNHCNCDHFSFEKKERERSLPFPTKRFTLNSVLERIRMDNRLVKI